VNDGDRADNAVSGQPVLCLKGFYFFNQTAIVSISAARYLIVAKVRV